MMVPACGFQLSPGDAGGDGGSDAGEDAAMPGPDGGDGDLGGGPDLASVPDQGPLPVPDGMCAEFANADLASSCTEPGAKTCFDVVGCVTVCTDDPCRTACYASAKDAKNRTDAMSYVDCRAAAAATGGVCFDPCQTDQARCIACLHVCSYDTQCRYGCSCGACAPQLAACFSDL
jgi:hypothetical protein